MSKRTRYLPLIVKEIATELELTYRSYGGHWLIVLTNPATGTRRTIYGNDFDLNSATARMVCCDKAFLSDLLIEAGIDCVEHTFFINPTSTRWAPAQGTLRALQDYTEKHRFDVVLKPKDGSLGRGVFHCTTQKTLEAAALNLFKTSYGLVACPYEDIQAEFRLFMLDGKAQFIYKKVKPHLVGDGKSTIRALWMVHHLQVSKTHGPHPDEHFPVHRQLLDQKRI